MTCLIVEDQPPAQRLLQTYIARTARLEHAGTYADPTIAFRVLRDRPVDVLLLDIHLPKLSGLDLLRLLEHPPHVILTTAYDRYAVESYELRVVDYLLKPIAYERFLASMAKVPRATAPAPELEELYVRDGQAYVRIDPRRLHYIRSHADYTELHEGDRRHVSAEPLRHWAEVLAVLGIVQVHKSYLVNPAYIDRLYPRRLLLTDGSELPIGRTFREGLTERLLGGG